MPRVQARDQLSVLIDGQLAPQRPPQTLPRAMAAARLQAAGHLQMLLRMGRASHAADYSKPRARHRCICISDLRTLYPGTHIINFFL